MKTRILVMGVLLAGLMADRAWALCEVQATPQTYSDGTVLNGNVCDTNGALKISGDIGNVSISSADGAITDGVSAAIKATVKDYTNSNPLTTILVDTNGDPASVGGGTQYAQGTASTTTDTMTMAGCVRVDTPAVASGVIDGDRARCMVDSTGRMWVHVGVIDGTVAATQSGTWNVGQSGTWTLQPGNTANTTPWLFSISQGGNTAAVNASSQLSVNCANCSGSGVSQQDNTGFTPGTTNFVPMGGEVDDTGTTAVTENSAGAARITAQRAVHMNLRNNSGTEIGTSGAPIRTDPTGSTTQPVSGTVSITANSSVNVAQMNGVTTSMGVGASGTGTQRVASLIHDGTDTAQVTNTSGGSLQVECTAGCSGSGGTSSNYGSAMPSAGTAAGFTDGTNMVAGRVVTSAPSTSDAGLVVRPISPASSTVGSAVPSVGVQVTGTDGTNARAIKTDTNGELQVDVLTLPSNASVNNAQVNGSTIQVATNSMNTTGAGLQATAMVGQCDDTSPTALTENQFGNARINCTTHEQLVTATQSGNWSTRNQDGSGNNLTSAARGSERALSVQIVDGSGAQITSFGGSGGTASNFGSAFPTPGTAVGFSDGTNMQGARVVDGDTGAGTVYVLGTNLLKRASGGPVEAGTSSDPLRVDPTGTTPQPSSQSGTWTVQPGNTANTTPWLTSPIPATSGGTSVCYVTSAASTNATNCKASAGQLYGFDLVNTTATVYYLRLYNLSSAPTCSSSTGFVRTIPIPAATTGAGIARSIPVGEAYGTGLGFCLTGGGSSTDNTNAATGVYVSLNYK